MNYSTVTLKAGQSVNLSTGVVTTVTPSVPSPARTDVIRQHITREARKNDCRAILFALRRTQSGEWK